MSLVSTAKSFNAKLMILIMTRMILHRANDADGAADAAAADGCVNDDDDYIRTMFIVAMGSGWFWL